MTRYRHGKKTDSSEKKGFYIKVAGLAVAIVTAILTFILTCDSLSGNTSSSVKQGIVIINNPAQPIETAKDAKPDLQETLPPLPKEKPADIPKIVQTPPLPETVSRKIFVPKIYGDFTSESAFDRNVRIDLMRIDDYNRALGKITVSGYEPQEFALDIHSPSVEIGRYSVMATETGSNYAEFSITRK